MTDSGENKKAFFENLDRYRFKDSLGNVGL